MNMADFFSEEAPTIDQNAELDNTSENEIVDDILDDGQGEIIDINETLDENLDEEQDDSTEEEQEETVEDETEDTETETEEVSNEFELDVDDFKLTPDMSVKRKVIDANLEEHEIEITDDDLETLAQDKLDGYRDTLQEIAIMTQPIVDTYTKQPFAKWVVDNMKNGYTEEQLTLHIADAILAKHGLVAVNPNKVQIIEEEQEELDPMQLKIRELEQQAQQTQRELEAMKQEKQAQQQKITQQTEQQTIIQKNTESLNRAYQEYGIDPTTLSDEDFKALTDYMKIYLPKDVSNPAKGFYTLKDKVISYSSIKGIVNSALVLNRPIPKAKQNAVKMKIKQASAPKVIGGKAVGSSSKQTVSQPKVRNISDYFS